MCKNEEVRRIRKKGIEWPPGRGDEQASMNTC
jgi:hypothetical protein